MRANHARMKQTAQAPDLGAIATRRRLLSGIGLLLVLAAAIWTGIDWLVDPAHTPLRKIEIAGELRHLDRSALQTDLEPLVEGGFFGTSVAAIQARVRTQAWVDQVSVRRLWPDRLRIEVTEHQAVALWGGSALLNERGEVFTPSAVPAQYGEALPRLEGPEGHAAQVLETYRHMTAMLRNLGLSIRALRQDERRSWQMTLSNGTQVQMGRLQPEQRLARFARAYPAILASAGHRIDAVDLRYSNGFAVRWSPDIQKEQTG